MPGTKTAQPFTLVFNKGEHKYVLRFQKGQEKAALDALSAWAVDPRLDFSLTDVLKASLAWHVYMRDRGVGLREESAELPPEASDA
ncbi:MAG: hypothetical protein HZA54_02410 [Planctomycetes bacterium]|nr:hypothetical protein [Planctomycetota bacterium]